MAIQRTAKGTAEAIASGTPLIVSKTAGAH